MKAMRQAAVVVMGVLLGTWCLRATPARAAGELQGRELEPAQDLQIGLETLLGHLLGGHKPPSAGRIESAVVTEDGDTRLAVRVTCSAGLEGRRLRGELLGRDRRTQRQFRTEPARLEGGAREVELTFELADGVAAGEMPDSAYLRVSVDGGGPEQKRAFTLNKSWQSTGGPGYGHAPALVRIKPRPEPAASALPLEEPAAGPVRPRPGVIVDPVPVVRARPVARDHRRPAPEVRDHRGEAPVVRDHRTDAVVLTRTAPAVGALRPATGRVLTMDAAMLQVSSADQSEGATRPSLTEEYDLLDELAGDQTGVGGSEVAGVRPLVFHDQNAASPFFYFMPESYHLGWRADQKRYDMAMLYLAAPAAGGAGEVSMAAGLTAGIDQREIAVAQKLLDAYCRRYRCPGAPAAPKLRPFPIDPARANVNLSGTLQLFNIPREKVAPVGLSTVLGDFQLAWVTDAVTKENVQLVMEQGGLNGQVTFAPPGAEQSGKLVDLQIKLADPGSFERSGWRRREPWRNPSPYPLRLKYLHALLIGADNRPAVYSWSLGNALVGPGGRVEWDASLVPEWLDRRALRMWVGYGLVEDCSDCKQQVLKSITAGVTSVAASQITFHTINPIAAMGAYELAVRVRSKRFDPDGRETKEKSVVLKADNQDFTLGPIYVGEDAGGSPALFEYFLTVAMADGTEHEARQWLPSSDLRVLIGRSQIEKALGFFPAGPGAPEPSPTPSPDPGR